MRQIKILNLQPLSPNGREKIEAVDPAVQLTDAAGWYDGEFRETWPAASIDRFLDPKAQGRGSRAERDKLLAETEIVIGGWPYPLDLRRRAPGLKWFHQMQAGASNLHMSDMWGSDVTATTSRGVGSTLAIAEYAIAGILHFAKNFHDADADRQSRKFNRNGYRALLIHRKTACVVGAGGIGQDVGRLCAALGMRVLGIRRQVEAGAPLPAGFASMGTTAELDAYLSESDVVIVCAQLTAETSGLINAQRFAAMKRGAILVNIARGEIVDENALLDALKRDRLRGAALDVYVGEFEHNPPEALWSDPRVLITPHTSATADDFRHGGLDMFCENLRAYLDGKPLKNVIDWERGY